MFKGQLLIYDGDCQFCQLSLDFAIRTLPDFPQFAAFQRINPELFGLTKKDVTEQIWLVSNGTKAGKSRLGGHLAAAGLLLGQRAWHWRALGHLIKTSPFSWLAKALYFWVARNRHRLPGGTATCKLEDTYFGSAHD